VAGAGRPIRARAARALTVLLAGLLAGGCGSVGGFFGAGERAGASGPEGGDTAASITVEELALYLRTMHALADGDPATQADAYREASDALNRSPTTTNRLRIALVLATPGHPWSNAADAQRMLGQLLASGNALLPEERILATIHLKEVEQRLMLEAEAEQLRTESAAAQAVRDADNARRLAAALEENRRLRAELDDALERLDAIATIERSIRERENGAD
jgi:hypothetical protein